ncbi:MAG TPA: NUDIX hydrolase [Geobacteraceae bacterium]|nr:NUDIX hydrolase [Geobacteraceae bacterium]
MKTRDHAVLFKGLVVDIEQFDVMIGEKGWHTYQIIRHPGGAAVLPLHDDGTVTLIRQLRPAVGDNMIEAPAGRLGPGEEPASCALRELVEEAGLAARKIESLGLIYPSPGVLDEAIHLFLASGLSDVAAMPEEYEEIAMVRIPLAEAVQMAKDGRITDGKTIALLLRADGKGG